jgi:hypothetical protein
MTDMSAAGRGDRLRANWLIDTRYPLPDGTLVRQATFGLFSRLIARRTKLELAPGVVQRANDSAMRLVDVSEQRSYGTTNICPLNRVSP